MRTARSIISDIFLALAMLCAAAPAVASAAPAAAFTAAGQPALGSPDAPVVIEEWSDYACPYCSRHHLQTAPHLLEKYVTPGQVQLVFRNFPIDALHPTAVQAHGAAHCAGEQGARHYWTMHNALFARQKEWSRLPDPASFLSGLAREQALDLPRFDACLASDGPSLRLESDRKEGATLGFNGTPSFRLSTRDGKLATQIEGAQAFERFEEIIQSLLAGKLPSPPPAPARPELPAWARPASWQADPARPGFNVGGDAYKGRTAAPLTVIAFTDYQCAGCARHELDVQPLLDREFVDSGQVLWIVKSLPLKEHAYAPLAATAAECAADQGGFWPMHRALFATQDRWRNARAAQELPAIAAEAGLDARLLAACLATREPLARVLADLYDAQDVVRTTPSFVLVKDGEGSLTGPLPADQFARLLRRELEPRLKPAP